MKLSAFIASTAVAGTFFTHINPAGAVVYCYQVDSVNCEIRIDGKARQKRKTEDVRNRKIIFDGEEVRVR